MNRFDIKLKISVLLSDAGILSKILPGRIDELVDGFDNAPDFWKKIVMKQSSIGKRDSRLAKLYILMGKVPERKRRLSSIRRPRPDISYDGWHIDFSKLFIKQLIDAGQDYASDFAYQFGDELGDISGPSFDIAESMLLSHGWCNKKNGFREARSAAGSYVAEGICKVLR